MMNVMFVHEDPHMIWPVQHDRHVLDYRWIRFCKRVYGLEIKIK